MASEPRHPTYNCLQDILALGLGSRFGRLLALSRAVLALVRHGRGDRMGSEGMRLVVLNAIRTWGGRSLASPLQKMR